MEKVVIVNKPIGSTPLHIIDDFKAKNPKYKNEKISYAGRLDPMAEGLLILLIGDVNKQRSKYENLDKTYETEIVFGIKTDTFDALGLIEEIKTTQPNMGDISKSLKKFFGKQDQAYPPYSSKTVNGKPLYWWARNNKLSKIEIPKKQIEIYKIEILNNHKIVGAKLLEDILKRINKVHGDFRQKEIIGKWKEFGEKNKDKKFFKITIRIKCTSGTYVRGLAQNLGEKIGCGAFCLSIKRTKIGSFTL